MKRIIESGAGYLAVVFIAENDFEQLGLEFMKIQAEKDFLSDPCNTGTDLKPSQNNS